MTFQELEQKVAAEDVAFGEEAGRKWVETMGERENTDEFRGLERLASLVGETLPDDFFWPCCVYFFMFPADDGDHDASHEFWEGDRSTSYVRGFVVGALF